jgi:putative sterol carrier protein
MSVRYCTPEWLERSAESYRANPRFQKELARLSTKICFKIKANPAWGIDKDIIFCAFVSKGELEEMAFFSEEDAKEQAEFILAASPQEWKRIMRKESKFVGDFMIGKILLEQGSKVGVISIAPHSNTFVDALTQVEVQFPDDMSPEELAAYRSHMEQFRSELGV